jgi:hypothetical protein
VPSVHAASPPIRQGGQKALNAVEIEQAITDLAEQAFDPATFPYAFLEAFGNKETTIKRLRAGVSNKSDLGGVLQTNNIHILTCDAGLVPKALKALKDSPATAKAKAKFILATDGTDFEAEDLASGETVACGFKDFPDHFGFFLPLAGITTVRQISENAFDIRATSRLNRLYLELLKDNPDWGKADRRHDMNHFMARLIFCFFAEDTGIFVGKGKFTETVAQMSAKDSSNTHEVIGTLFLAMNTNREERVATKIPRWAADFPYVNGGLFSGSMDVPKFSKIARSYLLHVGGLDWTKINPDIFGSMIQAVAEDEERGELGMHYTSVPNILKVLNPLFVDDLRAQLEEAGDNPRALLNLRKRMATIRVFDPACGSGNFLVIAYKAMREIEHEINKRRNEPDRRSEIPLTNFRGIELRDFPAEIARLALVVAEYQCDVLYRGQTLALEELLPLDARNWITFANALRLDWFSIWSPDGAPVKLRGDDLFNAPLDQAQIDFEHQASETYVCGNPPYVGGKKQSADQKHDMARLFGREQHKNLDYVCGFLLKTAEFLGVATKAALVTTNSVTQGTHVPVLWPRLHSLGCQVAFAYETFKWANNAQRNAGVSCTIIGLARTLLSPKYIYGDTSRRLVSNINPYLVDGPDIIVKSQSINSNSLSRMMTGNAAYDGGHLFLTAAEARDLVRRAPEAASRLRKVSGTSEFVDGITRYCLWLEDDDLPFARSVPEISSRLDSVLEYRKTGGEVATTLTGRPHQFRYRNTCRTRQILVPQISSERRDYIPVGLLSADVIITHLAHALYDPTLVDFAVLASKLHFAWIATICGKFKTDLRYSSNLGWNTFPIPTLTERNKADLMRCAEDILLAREHHFPATIADLYDPDKMPEDLRAAHERNDEVLERIYIGRRFKNDTERLEKLFDLYTRMTEAAAPTKDKRRKAGASA